MTAVEFPQPAPRKPNDPLISIVVFSYQFEAYIAECLRSIVDQTLRPYEIIVADDCSTDSSWPVIESFAEHYPDLVDAHRHGSNIGHLANGDFARRLVTGEFVSVIDGDDRWHPQKLEHEWGALRGQPEARVAYSNVRGINEYGEETLRWCEGSGKQLPRGDVFVASFARQFFPNVTSVYRNELVYADALNELGHLDRDIPIHVDWDLKLRLAAQFPVACAEHLGVDYRTHSANMNARTTDDERLASMQLVAHKNRGLLEQREPAERRYIREQLAYLEF